MQSGKPVGVFRTHAGAPRVLIANSNLVGRWATWDHFRELERAGLMMYGQMTAGSWIYIGSQGILQGTYETFGAVARTHFGGSLAGRFVLTAGLGGMGGAQPLAATSVCTCRGHGRRRFAVVDHAGAGHHLTRVRRPGRTHHARDGSRGQPGDSRERRAGADALRPIPRADRKPGAAEDESARSAPAMTTLKGVAMKFIAAATVCR